MALTSQNFNSSHIKLDIPESGLSSVTNSDHGFSDPEETRDEAELPEEDAQSVIGVSISRAQTRLMSPQTPAVEKMAALNSFGGDGFFDSAEKVTPTQAATCDSQDSHTQTLVNAEAEVSSSSEPSPLSSPQTLPSPWRATPKSFESHKMETSRPRASTSPLSVLTDMNVKRFMPNVSLPSFSIPTSVPSISSILGYSRDESPARKNTVRHRRANSATPIKPGKLPDRKPINQRPSRAAGHAPPVSPSRFHGSSGQDVARGSLSQSPSLRRTASDQSLMLRRTTSIGSSLGDDSRWENVQKQVNSRAKAIADSLQDSNIRLPSLPSLPSVNISSLRPEFLRNRAASDTRKPENNQLGDHARSTRVQGDMKSVYPQPLIGTNLNGTKNARKSPKPIYPHLDRALHDLTGDVVVMGGYRGSILRSAKPPHRQLWVPVKVGLNIRKVNLEVGLEHADEEKMEDDIVPSGMLSHIGPVDMGRRLLKRLKSCPNAEQGKLRVHNYGYDWRLSPHLLSRKLIAFLEQLPCNAKDVPRHERGATVIAHSLGGLVTRHAVNQRPELFAGVLFAGVPQHCVNILGPLRNGDDVLLSSKVLTAQVNFTLRTSYLLLPDSGKCFINKETKEEYPVNFFSTEDWIKYAFSPCVAPSSPPYSPPERKGVLSSVIDNLPSLPSLPLPGRKASIPYNSNNKDPQLPDSQPNPTTVTATQIATSTLDPTIPPPAAPSPRSTIPLSSAISYLTRTLQSTLAFRQELLNQPAHSTANLYPPHSVLYSTAVPTVSRARVASRDAIKCSDAYDDLAFASGDGVCLAKAAMLPEGYACVEGGKVRTERGHVGLLGDLEAVGRCLKTLGRARRKGVGLGTDFRGEE
ncbi:MAG: hypothetical protein LQ342_005040 [Letrouitia transgressa]|nr:MAG: hypothetical protein LQ342_005040 [Letrouitia transgressa]